RHTGSMADHEYTGHVDPGGPSGLQVLPSLEIRKASVGPMDNNAYLLTCRSTGAQLLIDAAADEQRLLALVAEGSAEGRLDTIVTTHCHHDHVGALEKLVGATGARTAAGAADAPEIAVPTDRELAHGDVIELGRQRLEVIALRGHTPGSVALLFRGGEAGDQLFTGDSLFPGGVGNTFGDAEAFAQLIDDVQQRLFDRLGAATWVYPGHGDDTTLGAERPSLPTWRERGWRVRLRPPARFEAGSRAQAGAALGGTGVRSAVSGPADQYSGDRRDQTAGRHPGAHQRETGAGTHHLHRGTEMDHDVGHQEAHHHPFPLPVDGLGIARGELDREVEQTRPGGQPRQRDHQRDHERRQPQQA